MSSLEQLTRGGSQAWTMDVGEYKLYIDKPVLLIRCYSGNWPGYALFKLTNVFQGTKIFRGKTLCLLVASDVSVDCSASVFIVNPSKDRRR